MSDPKIAIVELVANAWDAGATQVDITWPTDPAGEFNIEDNGTGMSEKEFRTRWLKLGYDRRAIQGDDVTFPPDVHAHPRRAYGRNGKGRHAMFCFAYSYNIELCTIGDRSCRFKVERLFDSERDPIRITPDGIATKAAHGVRLQAVLVPNQRYMNMATVRDLIGSKFISDPSFGINVNTERLELQDLAHRIDSQSLHVPGVGDVVVHIIDSGDVGRTSKQHGVAWWVNKRLVGEASWRDFDTSWLDARSSEAKRYTFIVEADILAQEVGTGLDSVS